MAEQLDIVMPEVAIGVLEREDGTEVMTIEFTTASTSYTAVLAFKDNYRQVADKISEGIRRAGAEMKAPKSKLVTNIKEIPDALRKNR